MLGVRQLFRLILSVYLLVNVAACDEEAATEDSGAFGSLPETVAVTGTLQVDSLTEAEVGEIPVEGQKIELTDSSGYVVSTGVVEPSGTFKLAVDTTGLALTAGAPSVGNRFLYVSSIFLGGEDEDPSAVGVRNQIVISPAQLQGGDAADEAQMNVGEMTAKKVGAILGKITLASGETPVGIDVYVPGTTHIAKTDKQGHFLLGFLPAGTYTIRADFDGFMSQEWDGIQIGRNQTVSLPDSVMNIATGAKIESFALKDGSTLSDTSQVVLSLVTTGASKYRVSQFADYSDTFYKVIDTTKESTEITFFLSGEDGIKEVHVMAADNNGSFAEKTLQIYLDRNKPKSPDFTAISVNYDDDTKYPRAGYTNSQDVTITVEHCNDVKSIFITENQELIPDIIDFSYDCEEAKNGILHTLSEEDGEKTLYLWSLDFANQISDLADIKSQSIVLDTVAPIISLSPEPNTNEADTVLSNTSIELTLSTNEDVTFFYNFDSSTPSPRGSQILASESRPAKLVIIASASLATLAYDDAGNISTKIDRDFYINRDGPLLGSISTTGNLKNSINISLTLSAQRASKFTISESISSLLDGAWIDFSGPNMAYTYTLDNTDDGAKTLYAAFMDDAGNMIGEGGEFSTSFTLDRTSPSEGKISLYQPESPTGAFNTPLAWSSEIDESSDGAVTYTVEVHQTSAYTDSLRTMSTTASTLTINPPLTDAGTYYWRVRAEDAAGNATSWVESGTDKSFQLAILAQSYQAKTDYSGDSSTERHFGKELVELGDYNGDGVPEVAYSILQADFNYGSGSVCQSCGLVQVYDRENDEIIASLHEALNKSANYGHRVLSCDLTGDGVDEIVVSAPNEAASIDGVVYKDAGSIYAYEFDASSQSFSLLASYSNSLGSTNPASGYSYCNLWNGAECAQYGWDFWPNSIESAPWPGDRRLFGWDITCATGQGADGDSLIVGEPFYDDGSYDRGRVVELQLQSGSFTVLEEVLGPTDQVETGFGSAVEYLHSFLYGSCSTAGPTLAVGRPRKNVNGDQRGSVSLYQIVGGSWTNCDTIDAADDDPSWGYYGNRLFNLGDIDKDGSNDELAVATQYYSGGAVRVFGGSSGTLLASYRDTSNDLNMLGYHVGPSGDFNSDSQGDLIITAPNARVNGQWGAGTALVLDWTSLDSTDNNTGTALKTITGRPQNSAYLGASMVPIRSTAFDIHSETVGSLISSPGKVIDGQWSVGSFHEFSLIKMAPSLPTRISGTSTNAQMGRFITATSDLDGDSVSDFVIGQPGGVCNGAPYGAVSIYSVLDGKINANICDVYHNDLGLAGVWLPSATDLLFGKKGSAYVVDYYSILQKRDITDTSDYPSTHINYNMDYTYPYISEPHTYSGNSYTDEVLLANHTYWGTGQNQGRVTLTHVNWSFDDRCRYIGTVDNGKFGYSVSFINDLNGDGEREILVGAPGESIGSSTGRVYVIDGSMATGDCVDGNSLSISDSHALTLFTIDADDSAITAALGSEANGGFGSKVLGLPDYDGTGDAKAYLYVANTNMKITSSSATPQYFIFRVNSDNSISLMKTETGLASGMLGGNVKLLDDINGDGLQELAISYPGGVGRLGNTGHVRVISGAGIATSTSSDDLIQMLFNPEPSVANFGVSIEYGDITGDGLKDFVIGADEYDSGVYQDAGAVYTFAMEPIQE